MKTIPYASYHKKEKERERTIKRRKYFREYHREHTGRYYKGEYIAHAITSGGSPNILEINATIRKEYKVIDIYGKDYRETNHGNFKILRRQ